MFFLDSEGRPYDVRACKFASDREYYSELARLWGGELPGPLTTAPGGPLGAIEETAAALAQLVKSGQRKGEQQGRPPGRRRDQHSHSRGPRPRATRPYRRA